MYPASARFFNAVRRGHFKLVVGDVMNAGELVPGGEDVPIIGGSLTDDITSAIRRRCTLAISPKDLAWVPGSSEDLLWPTGNELRLKGGIQYSDGSQELVPLGIYRISRPKVVENNEGIQVNVDGYDRARTVSRGRFRVAKQILKDTNYAEAIQGLISEVLPNTVFNFIETDHTTPELLYDHGGDPWEAAQELASNIGCELYFDAEGICVLRAEVNPSFETASWIYDDAELSPSELNSGYLEAGKDLDDDQAYNGVIVNGENPDEPVYHAEAWDTNPNSRTYYDPDQPEASSYGPVPYFYFSQYFTSQEQAQDTANAFLLRVAGILEQVDVETIVNPAHEAGDVIQVTNQKTKINSLYTIDSLTFGLGLEDSMSISTRQRQVLDG